MKLRRRIATAIGLMLTISMLTVVSMVTVLADVVMETEAEAEESSAMILGTPEKAWWQSQTVARWKSVKQAKQYQVKLYEFGGLDLAVETVKVSATSYDFTEFMEDGKQYYFMVRAIPKVSEQQVKNAGEWITSKEGDPVAAGDTTGKWRYFLEGSCYEKADGTAAVGWQMIYRKWYYFSETGYVVTNSWLDWEGSRYYLTDDGSLQIGWLEWDDNWYYFNQDGQMMTGWINGENPAEKYYLYPDGTMAHETVIDGYTLNADGLAV